MIGGKPPHKGTHDRRKTTREKTRWPDSRIGSCNQKASPYYHDHESLLPKIALLSAATIHFFFGYSRMMLYNCFQLEASSSSARTSKPILNHAGRIILKAFYENVSHKPTRDQKLELLRNVIVAGNSHYDEPKLTAWFAKHRQQTRKTELLSVSGARPAFTPQAEAELAICFNETPHPSDELVAIWARGFNVTADLCMNGLHEEENDSLRRVPTPTTTPIVSPMSLPSSSPIRHASMGQISHLDKQKQPTLSERLLRAIGEDMDRVDLAPLSWRSSGDASPSSPMAVSHSSLSTDASALSPLESSLFIPQHQAPRFMTANDFHASFAPYELKMTRFMDMVRRVPAPVGLTKSAYIPNMTSLKL
ncbi:hypothetical protein CPB85DRAFT_1257484 [Mucidula mucida]|nr:hypothetical protein CPB85DRAFT_1257484 [Mucidula mucida]